MLYSIVGILVIILDQAVKFWVSDTLFGTDVVRFIPGVISLVNVHNDGAAFSFLSGSGADTTGAKSLTAAQMKLKALYNGFDFDNVWFIDSNGEWERLGY